MLMKKIVLAAACCIPLCLCGCRRQKSIELNSLDVQNISPDREWAVVTVPYAALRTEADSSSSVSSHARSGDIFLVCGKKYVKAEPAPDDVKKIPQSEYVLWYKCGNGWIAQQLVAVYDTRLKAEAASRKRQ